MRIRKYIFTALALIASTHIWAQSEGPIHMPTEYVSVCTNQGPYFWRGQTLNQSGTYTSDEGDYIYTLKLTMDDVVHTSHSYQMPEGSSIKINGKFYTKAGTYYDTIGSGEVHCDTIDKIVINYALSYNFYDTVHQCGNVPYMWQGKLRNQAKDYIEKYRTKDNKADSIYHLALFFDDPIRYHEETKYWCKSKLPYVWNGLKIYEECDTTRTLTTKYGCDSVVTLHLKLIEQPASFTKEVTEFCPSDGHYTHGQIIHKETTWRDTLLSYCGCDSIVERTYKPYPGTFFKETIGQHFKGDPYEWRGKIYTSDGIYRDTADVAPGPNECYSIYQLQLVTKYEIYDSQKFCEGAKVELKTLDGKTRIITEEYIGIDTLKTKFGADSIVHRHITFAPAEVIYVDSITICGNEKYTWEYEGKKLVIDGKDYRNQKKTEVRTVELNLGNCRKAKMVVTVVPYYITDSIVIRCNEDIESNPFTWVDHKDSVYVFGQKNMDKTILDTLNAPIWRKPGEPAEIGDCPNILRFRFISTSTCSPMDTFSLCPGDSIKIDGKWYNKPGTYFNTMSSITYKQRGLKDSIHNFTIIPSTLVMSRDTIHRCESDPPYEYKGRFYTYSRLDTIPLKYKGQSCDSAVIFLCVKTKPKRISPIQYYHFCANEPIHVQGISGEVIFTTPGYHTDTLHIPYDEGCDTIVQYLIQVHPSTQLIDTAYMRPGETYRWTYHGRDSLITQPGIYTDSTKVGPYQCDSVRTLVLNMNEPFDSITTDTACANHPYVWRGQNYYRDTIIVDTVYDSRRDTIFKLNLVFHPVQTTWRYIHLLPDTSYNFHGHILTLAEHMNKTFVDTTTSISTGCDSINKITILPVEPDVIDTVLCPNQQLYISGKLIVSGYADTVCVDGDWSITKYVITRSKQVINERYEEINPGEQYEWTICDGTKRILSSTGIYLDTCANQYGCDSINRLKLVVKEDKFYPEGEVNVCYNQLPYLWHGQSLDKSGNYTAKFKTSMGRDSVFNIDFKVIDPIHVNIKIDTCYTGQAIYINNKPYRKNTAFVDTFMSVQTHCDSIVHYVLELHYPVTRYEQKTLNEGSSFIWHGQTIDHGDVYYHHSTTPFGCDSTIILTVTECPHTVMKQRYIMACEGDVIRINGDTIRESGTYDEYNKTINGCDSIVRIKVDFTHTDWKYSSQSMHKNDTIYWRNKTLVKPGTYYDTIRTSKGTCDSVIYCLYLQQVIILERDTTVFSCDGTYYHKGKGPYFRDSVITDTIYNLDGKDSLYFKWHYRLISHCSEYDSYYLCPGETRDIEGVIVKKAGNYFAARLTDLGEDSLYRFTVKDGLVYENTIPLEGCDSIVYSGRTYLYHGTDEPFYQTLRHTSVKYGCDSIEHLKLTIHSSKRQYDRISIGDFQLPYEYNGRTYNTSCRDTFNYFTSPYGCDSLLILILQVLPTFNDTTRLYYCKGDPNGVNIYGKKYYPEHDIVVDSLFHVGDDMVRRTTIVYVNQPFTITSFDPMLDQQICATNKLTFYVQYDLLDQSTGAMPTSYDVDFSVGDLDAHPKHATYPVNGKKTLPIEMDGLGTSVHPGYYSYAIRFRSEGCPVSDTTLTGSVLVRYPAEIMEANWNNMITLVNEEYNAGHWSLIPPFAWQVWNSAGEEKTAMVVPNNQTQAYIASNNLREKDVVVATLYRDGYPRAIPSCPFTFVPVNFTGEQPIFIYPTTVKAKTMVHVSTPASGEYQIFTATGHKCQQGALCDGDNTLPAPSSVGCYLLHVTLQDGSTKLQRILVH